MLEAIIIIVALGGLEVALWWADHKRQQEQLQTLEAIWVELALMNDGKDRPQQAAPAQEIIPAAHLPIGPLGTMKSPGAD
ncbi:MAG: hypothetical protein WBC04_22780 [Candidatus Acidiferrales bacterium]